MKNICVHMPQHEQISYRYISAAKHHKACHVVFLSTATTPTRLLVALKSCTPSSTILNSDFMYMAQKCIAFLPVLGLLNCHIFCMRLSVFWCLRTCCAFLSVCDRWKVTPSRRLSTSPALLISVLSTLMGIS